MRATAILVAGACLGACGAAEGEPGPTGPLAYQVLHYDYALDLESRAASAVLTIEVTEPGDCLTIPFRASALDDDVTLGGEPLRDGALAGGRLEVCGRGWPAGAELELAAHMTVRDETWGDSQVGFSVRPDAEGAPFTYLVSWLEGCDRFGPCDAAPDRFARYRFTIAHPAGTQVLCPGTLAPGETISVCDFGHEGGPTYSTFGVAAGPSWVVDELGDWDGVRVTLYDLPSVGMGEALDREAGAGFLAWMAGVFGPYPYGDELRLIAAPTYWNGFEHPGNIVLSQTLPGANSSYSDPLTHTLLHELAHQWAGDQATLATTYDFVWKEAMAEYLTFVFEDEQLGAEVALATARAWKRWARAAEFHPVPGERPLLLDYYGDVYGAGPMVLFRQLEALYGRPAVLAALRDLLGAPRALAVADVQAALEQATGADLAAYFDTWVHGEGKPAWPEVEVAVGDGAVTVTQVGEPPYAGCAFAVRLTGEGGAAHDVWFDFGPDGSRSLTEIAEPGFAVTGHVVDPDAQALVWEAGGAVAPQVRVNPWVVGD